MTVSLSDVVTYKRLIAAGNMEVWYEMPTGTLVELNTAGYTVDTSDQLNMFELFQKVFVVNGSILGVADFLNSKIVDANGFTNKPSKGDIVYQNGSDPATIIVDFITGTSLYGYAVDGTIETATAIRTQPSGGGDVILPSPDSVTSAPHWRAWTPYDNNTGTYGSMPDSAYLGCNYRGRAVLSGNPAYPYQWYMSRQGNPWDWAYVANDAQTPVAGNNADAGEVGDIIRALIPFKDQYLIFGCSGSLWYLRGDPAVSGAVDSIDRTVGIFGAYSWCFSNDSLYFWGTGGIYKCDLTEVGPSKPQLLTGFSLPDICRDEDIDASTHRVTMGYDRKRLGILISVTKLLDGTNSNYWYDLRTEGLFPETYPDECGVYSMCYYDANDNNYADLLLGSRDGYIDRFNDEMKNDNDGTKDVGQGDRIISSDCVLPITKLSKDEDREGLVTSMTVTTSGGEVGGTFSDTDSLSYERHVSDGAETCLENIVDGATPLDSGVLTGTGRKNRIRNRARGKFLGIKLYNNAASETWAVDEVQIDTKESGRK